MSRKICPVCQHRPVAVNYVKEDVTHYRRVCDPCSRAGKKNKEIPSWYKAGYRKKPQCEKCGFKFKFPVEQSSVYYVDGDLRNNNHFNLKTVCLNCQQEIARGGLPWKASPLTPDF